MYRSKFAAFSIVVTISFRISDAERKQIEARILASGMMKKDYFVRSCIYNHICVVGKKETIYPLVQTVNALYLQILDMQKAFTSLQTYRSDYCLDSLPQHSSPAQQPHLSLTQPPFPSPVSQYPCLQRFLLSQTPHNKPYTNLLL